MGWWDNGPPAGILGSKGNAPPTPGNITGGNSGGGVGGAAGIIPPGRPTPPVPPRASQSPSLPTASDLLRQTSESGRALPIVYGTIKVAGNIIERATIVHLDPNVLPAWAPTTAYPLGYVVQRGNWYCYVCITAGTSGTTGPDGTGLDITDGTVHWCWVPRYNYRQPIAIGLCEGTISGIGKTWKDKESFATFAALPHSAPFLDLSTGAAPQTRPGWATWAVGAIDTYGNTAVVWIDSCTGPDNTTPQYKFEVQGLYSSATDANPADILIDLFTHARRGAAMPSARINAASTGSGAASWRTYCTAAGLVLSWCIDSQQTLLDLTKTLLAATNTECVWSGGQFRFVPLGDEEIVANGVTFTPDNVAVYDLDPDDYLEPISISRVSSTDTYNSFPVEYIDRAAEYAKLVVDDPAMDDVDRRGLKRASVTSFPYVMAPDAAVMLSRVLAQRSLHVRNQYQVKLPARFLLLEPTDLLTLSDPVIGLDHVPVRIVEFEETVDDDGSGAISLLCEDWPAGVAAAATYTPQTNDGYRPNLASPVNGLIVGAGQIETGGVTADRLADGTGINGLYNSDFSAGVPTVDNQTAGGWTISGSTSGLVTAAGLCNWTGWTLGNQGMDPKNPYHANAFYVQETGHAGGTAYVDVQGPLVAVHPGKRYAWSIYTGAHRCNVSIYCVWIQADGSTWSTIKVTSGGANTANNAELSGGTRLDGWKRVYLVDDAPSDAGFMWPIVRKRDTLSGEADSFVFAMRGQVEETGDHASAPGPWVPSASTMINNAARSGTYRVAYPGSGSSAVLSGDISNVTFSRVSAGSYIISDARIVGAESVVSATTYALGVRTYMDRYAGVGMHFYTMDSGGLSIDTAWTLIVYP